MPHRLRVVLAVALVLSAATAVAAHELTPRVRALDECASRIVDSARRQSPTVRELERRLGLTDVVAYVRCFWPNGGQPDAYLSWVSATPGTRYVLLSVAQPLPPWRRVEMLGHEMQHALEVADASWVRSDVDLERLYGDIGRRTRASRACFETEAAQTVEWEVRRDLSATSASGQPSAGAVAESRQGPPSSTGTSTAQAVGRPRNPRR